jgi:outer membrane murein-binding lipoprotein Lpp
LKHHELAFRLVVVLVVLGSLGLAWWSIVSKLAPLQNQSRELTSAVGSLSAEVDALEHKWSRTEAEQIREKYLEAKRLLFADQAALDAWLASLQAMAASLDLKVKTVFGKPGPQSGANLAVLPATVSIELRPAARGAESGYRRLLKLSQCLIAGERRADLAELTVTAQEGRISMAEFVFNLWAAEEGAP